MLAKKYQSISLDFKEVNELPERDSKSASIRFVLLYFFVNVLLINYFISF